MEKRRLGQRDRGRGGTRQYRVRRVIELTMVCCVVLGLSSCSATESNEQTAEVEQKITGPDGQVIFGKTGVVDVVYTIEDLNVSCTGSMIAPHVVLTAARCLLPQDPYDPHEGDRDVTIHYYDPKSGRRLVHAGLAHWVAHPSFPDYSLDPGARRHGRPRVHPGRPRHPGFPGHGVDPFAFDEADTSKNDLAVIVVPDAFGGADSVPTDYHDYLRIFAGAADAHLNDWLNAFGAGLYDVDSSDDQLRYAYFDTRVENNGSQGPDFLRLEGRQGDDRVNMCRGDNGGPIEYSVTVEGQPVPTVAAVWSNYNYGSDWAQDESLDCANNNHTHDDSCACIVNNDHVQWIESASGLSCVPQSGGNIAYKRCFDIPFIEDVPGEGLYDRHVATAIVMAALW